MDIPNVSNVYGDEAFSGYNRMAMARELLPISKHSNK